MNTICRNNYSENFLKKETAKKVHDFKILVHISTNKEGNFKDVSKYTPMLVEIH